MTDWKPGDLARCVDVRDIRVPLRAVVARGGKFLVHGMVYIVQGTATLYGSEPGIDVGAKHGFKLACRFVKVPPIEDSEAERRAERELVDG